MFSLRYASTVVLEDLSDRRVYADFGGDSYPADQTCTWAADVPGDEATGGRM
jgi:hypothetical protein